MIPTPDQIRGIYAGIETCGAEPDFQGWGSEAPIFMRLFEELSPRVGVEVGSWKGCSVIHMARIARYLDLNTRFYAIDFWQDSLGQDVEGSQIPRFWKGEISAYQQFLYNVKFSAVHDRIIPIRTYSPHGAPILQRWGVEADLIYIDAGHTFEATLGDLKLYWDVLAPNGVMFGHDWLMLDVQKAVLEFCELKQVSLQIEGEHWVLGSKV